MGAFVTLARKKEAVVEKTSGETLIDFLGTVQAVDQRTIEQAKTNYKDFISSVVKAVKLHGYSAPKTRPELVQLMNEITSTIWDRSELVVKNVDLLGSFMKMKDGKPDLDCDTSVFVAGDIFEAIDSKLVRKAVFVDNYHTVLKVELGNKEFYFETTTGQMGAMLGFHTENFGQKFPKSTELDLKHQMNDICSLYSRPLFDREKYTEAIPHMKKIARLLPYDQINKHNLMVAHYNRGLEEMEHKRYAEARKDFLEVLSITPRNAMAFYNLGYINEMQERWNEAMRYYEKAIDCNSKLTVAYHERGVVKSKLGDWNGALEDLNKAIALNPNKALYYQNRAAALKNLGRMEEARRDEEEARRHA